MPFDLIIWDCDGCLVDSEVVACEVEAHVLSEWGYPISARDLIDRFAGKSANEVKRVIEAETGRVFDLGSDTALNDQLLREAFEKHLMPVEGIVDVLPCINLPMCIASGSSIERNTHALQITQLYALFEGKIFSSSQVAHGKPAPDIFLFAAAQMGAELSRCLVIEDSVAGVTAARAAGMTVFAYMGGAHVNDAWKSRVAAAEPDTLFDDMRQLPELVLGCAKA